MKDKLFGGIVCLFLGIAFAAVPVLQTQAAEDDKIIEGIFVEDISLEGKTAKEAQTQIEEYVEELKTRPITLITVGGNEVSVTPADMGFSWENPEIVEEAVLLGRKGNIVERFKTAQDLKHTNKIYSLVFHCDEELMKHVLTEQCSVYNQEAQDATLSRVDGSFVIQEGHKGEVVDEEASLALLRDFLCSSATSKEQILNLIITEDEVRGTTEELSKVKDLIGSFHTNFRTSGTSRSANVRNGCSLIDGTTLYPGDEFSTYEAVSPFSTDNGYYLAGSYLNGQVVDSLGGGICQVSTTLYNAVLLAELEVTERHNHSMIVTYVDPSADAAISESAGKDFKFKNNTDTPIYIEGYTTDDKNIYFNIYGQETRDTVNRVVSYQSEVVSKTYPDTEVIYPDAGQPIGAVSVQSAHVGYKANLWKIVTENGAETSREMVNSSVYKMVPRSAIVGVATADPNAYNEIMAAISTNSIDQVKGVAAALAAIAAPPAAAPAEGDTIAQE